MSWNVADSSTLADARGLPDIMEHRVHVWVRATMITKSWLLDRVAFCQQKCFPSSFVQFFFLTCHLEISNSNRNLFSTDQVGRKSQNKFNNHNVKQVDTIHKIYKDKNELLLVLIHLDTWIKVILIYLQPYGEVIFIYKYSRLSESRLFTYWIVDLHENVNFWFYRRNTIYQYPWLFLCNWLDIEKKK